MKTDRASRKVDAGLRRTDRKIEFQKAALEFLFNRKAGVPEYIDHAPIVHLRYCPETGEPASSCQQCQPFQEMTADSLTLSVSSTAIATSAVLSSRRM